MTTGEGGRFISLPDMARLSADHLAEAHRPVITLAGDAVTRSDIEHVAAVTRPLTNRGFAVTLQDDA